MNKQPISRRSFAAGLALAPVAGLPAIAGAVNAGDDPVLAALAEHERLQVLAKAAEEASNAADRAFVAARETLGLVMFKGEDVYSLEYLECLAGHTFRSGNYTYEKLEAIIADIRQGWAIMQAEMTQPDVEYEAARSALEARLPAYEGAKIESGIDAAEETMNAAFDDVSDAERTIFETAPTSRAGAVALLRFTADFLDELGINDMKVDDVLPDALRAAADFFEGEA